MSFTKEDVVDVIREWCEAWSTRDARAVATMESRAVGFGFRTIAWQNFGALDQRDRVHMLEELFGGMDSYRAELEDVQSSVVDGIGLGWGVFIEEFQETGRPPERARVRFSMALTKGATGWQVLLFHRDIQPFDEQGRYPRSLTVVLSGNGESL